ncbi:DEAD-domain-containing protein [Neolentinus lepideus HHB14362 ss-1]|uniref:RNA helicase n=1 Tax=Neolentinus lepideus HHB14362 ss-1 TaxID=1314782 RepID=A0A165S4Z8_9AGAM|nr:DEAD-domain-containing protein [Neolentinus lepideus HHB14362 ss-1]
MVVETKLKHKQKEEETDTVSNEVRLEVKAERKKKKKRDLGDAQDGEGPDTREKKSKKKKKKHLSEGAGASATRESERPPGTSSSEKEKKKKRKHAEDDLALDESSQERKKRKKEKGEHVPSEHKEKKKKKRSKEQTVASEAAQEVEAQASTSHANSASQEEIDAFLSKHSIKIHSPKNSASPSPVLSFDLDIPSSLRSALSGFKEPTPIQACTWPPALQGLDVVGIAETGSGKTLAFGLPALAHFTSKKKSKGKGERVNVLVLAPTRELAIQTHDTLLALGEPFGIASVALFGGVEKGPQIKTLKNLNKDGKTTKIVVGTPGRILDLVNDGACDLSGVDYLVLDEADRMLDKGFENDIRSIVSHTKQGLDRQTLMFSATWPEAVRRLASTFQRDPVRVTVGSDDLTANSRVEQVVEVFDDPRSKDQRLTATLRAASHKKTSKPESDESRILVFALYKKEASRVEQNLRRQGYSVGALHGDMSQSARMEALENFKKGKTGLLVATDVAARGLDIPNVGLVINYTFPLTIEDYIHRLIPVTYTGRGGRSGKSITFFTGEGHERALAGELARVLRESGFQAPGLAKFPMTIKKKTHSAYGAFYRDDIPAPAAPTKIKF